MGTRSAAAPSPARPAHAAPTRRGEWWDRSTHEGWVVGTVQLGAVRGGTGPPARGVWKDRSNREGRVVGMVQPIFVRVFDMYAIEMSDPLLR